MIVLRWRQRLVRNMLHNLHLELLRPRRNTP